MTYATATLTTQDAIARGRSERAQAFSALLRWMGPSFAARPTQGATA